MTAPWLQEIRDRRERRYRQQETDPVQDEPDPRLLPAIRSMRRRGTPIRTIADFFGFKPIAIRKALGI